MVAMDTNARHLHIEYTDGAPLAPDDPRGAMARSAQAARAVITAFGPDDASAPTPCTDWDALTVAQHMVAVVCRAAAGPTDQRIDEMPVLADVRHDELVDSLDAALHGLQRTWTDHAALTRMIDVPWGTFPGAAVIGVYSSELLVHTWDLAVAIGVQLNWPEADIAVGLAMSEIGFPDGPREQMPFDSAVRPTADAPAIEHLAGWVGRDVNLWGVQ